MQLRGCGNACLSCLDWPEPLPTARPPRTGCARPHAYLCCRMKCRSSPQYGALPGGVQGKRERLRLMLENIHIGPAGEVQLGPVGEEIETGPRQFGAALPRQHGI